MKFLFYFSFLLAPFFALAQAGAIDKIYGKDGFFIRKSTETFFNYPTQKSVIQQDNKLVYIEDNKDSLTNILSANVIRLTANGVIDKTFGTNGITTISLPNSNAIIISLSLQADGKILLTGLSDEADAQILVFRLNANGSFDGTFGKSGMIELGQPSTTDVALAIKSVKDGKILIGGVIQDSADVIDVALIRLNSNGTIDNTFGNQGVYRYTEASTVSDRLCFNFDLDKNGNIFVIGSSSFELDNYKAFLIKVNANGTLDKTFGQNGSIEIDDDNADDIVFFSSIKVQGDGKIVVLKKIIRADETNATKLIRYLASGKEDATFGTAGVTTLNFGADNEAIANDLLLQSDGKIIVNAGNLNSKNFVYRNATLRYDNKGSIDKSFGTQGITTIESDSIDYYHTNLLMASDGKIIISSIGQNANSMEYHHIAFRLLNPEVTATENAVTANSLKIFPNPVQNDFVLSYTLEKSQNTISINLVNIEGKIVANLLRNATRNSGEQSENIRLEENITNGVYFLEIKADEHTSRVKIVKM
jgi:uncharacterized delta-60 repeat protein